MSTDIGGAKLKRGEKARGFLTVGEAATHEVKLPYIVLNGVGPGPTLCVLGGVHALECAPVEALLRLGREMDARNLGGRLILVPVVNTEGFHRRTPYHNDLDHLNQNRVFPGDLTGSMTRRVASTVFDQFVSKADYLVDAHSADLGEDASRSVIIWQTTDEALQQKMVEIASCFDVDYIESSPIEGQTGEAVKRFGIPCIMTESGAPYPIREVDIKFHLEGLKNLMRHLRMLPGEVKLVNVPLNPRSERLYSGHGGAWRKKVEIGQRVKEGDRLGEVSNLIGDEMQVVDAPFEGKITFLRTHYSVNAGDTLLTITEV